MAISEARKAYLREYYQKASPEKRARHREQSLRSYHKLKGSPKEREKRDRYNAKRRKGAAKGNYGPRAGRNPEVKAKRKKPYPARISLEPNYSLTSN